MSLKEQISEDMKTAMRAKDSARLGTIRLLLAAIKQKEVDERIVLDDAQVTTVIDKMLKQRRDSISQYESACRQDLADAEKFELEVLTAYMPQQMSADEVRAVIAEVIAAVGAAGPADMGKVMAPLKAKLAGRTDMAQASALVKAALSGNAG
ncbi:GatB/YqeY domain-containing protein [Methyloversatilis sp. MC4-4]|uniref:GatB/YqeY domain-containing protein n=1 Tax=Methyloversatilis sp. MC4-4 TaxID=3132824 RepID=UPI003CF00896